MRFASTRGLNADPRFIAGLRNLVLTSLTTIANGLFYGVVVGGKLRIRTLMMMPTAAMLVRSEEPP